MKVNDYITIAEAIQTAKLHTAPVTSKDCSQQLPVGLRVMESLKQQGQQSKKLQEAVPQLRPAYSVQG